MSKIGSILCLLLVLCITQVKAQLHLTGLITDSAGFGLSHATIKVFTERDTTQTLSENDGSFFVSVKTAKGIVEISMKGYHIIRVSYSVPAGVKSSKLKRIILHADYKELDPVIVSRPRPITIGIDTISYHAAAYPVRDGSAVEDILKRLPGVEVDLDGNVVVQGKKIERVLINGKPFFGGDVLLAIRNFPADIVDKLQIIDDYGDKARLTGIKSGEPAKVLNIVLQQDKRNGQFGHLLAGAGNEGKYTSEVFGNAFHGDRQISGTLNFNNNSSSGTNHTRNAGFNYANQWNPRWNGSMNISAGGEDSHFSGSLDQDNYYPGEQLHQDQTTETKSGNRNYSMGGTLSYIPNEQSLFRISPSVSSQQTSQQVAGNSTTVQKDSAYTKSTNSQTTMLNKTTTNMIGSDIYYENKFPHSRSRFSAQVTLNYSKNTQTNDNQLNNNIKSDSLSFQSFQNFHITNLSNSWNISAATNYLKSLGTTGFIELGYTNQSGFNRQVRQTLLSTAPTDTPEPVDSLSQDYFYRSTNQQIHIGYTGQFNHLNVAIAMDAQSSMLNGTTENTKETVSYRNFSFLPSFQGNWALSKKQTLSFGYQGSPGLPSLQQVSPITDLTNPQYPITGNPGLKPSFTNNVSLHYEQTSLQATQFFGFGTTLGYTNTQNSITTSTRLPKDSSQVVYYTTYVNAGNSQSFYSSYHVTLPAIFNKHLRTTYSGNLSYGKNTILTDNLLYAVTALSWSQSLHIQYLLPNILETNFEAKYSITRSSFPSTNNLPAILRSANWRLNSKYYILKNWILSYDLAEVLSTQSHNLQATPMTATAVLQRQFLAKNRATVSLFCYNLFNGSAGITQSTSPTSTTLSQTELTQRYFLLTFKIRLENFHR